MARFGVGEQEILDNRFTPAFVQLMRFEVERTRELFAKGMPLLDKVDARLKLDLQMFTAGGTEVLRRIEAQGYDVLTSRPSIPKSRQLIMLAKRLLHL
jgi:phytoene/squalene synthetase